MGKPTSNNSQRKRQKHDKAPRVCIIVSMRIYSMSMCKLHDFNSLYPQTKENRIWSANAYYIMMTSSNGNIFRVTGHLCGEFTGPRWIPNNRKAGDLRPYRAHYDVTVMLMNFNMQINNRRYSRSRVQSSSFLVIICASSYLFIPVIKPFQAFAIMQHQPLTNIKCF